MSDIILYDYWRSSASYRVRIALNLAGIQYKTVAIDLLKMEHKAPEHLIHNPQGLVPALKIDEQIFTQSLAIIEYLNETRNLVLLPNTAAGRAEVRLPPALDIENSPQDDSRPSRKGRAELTQWILDWCAEVEQASGVKPLIYTNRDYASQQLGESLNQYLLWLATDNGISDSDPKETGIWATWTFHQYRFGKSNDPVVPGFKNPVDLDSFPLIYILEDGPCKRDETTDVFQFS